MFFHSRNDDKATYTMKEVITIIWWLYVLVIMIPQIFIWEGIDMLFIKFVATMIMLLIPFIFD